MKKLLAVAVAGTVLGSAQVSANVSEAEFEQLRADMIALSQRLNALEQENAELKEMTGATSQNLEIAQTELASVKKSSEAGNWADRIKMKGDFRYRYETIDVQGASDRERNRIRARAAFVASLPSDVDVGLGFASGGSDPVSSNQTLGGGNSSKELRLDLAYAKWDITEDFNATAGKFSNPLYRPQKTGLMWDGDWRPEGLSAGWSHDILFANFLGNWLESDSKKGNDEFAWGLQGGTKLALGSATLTATLGYYDFPTEGNESYFDDDFFGNSSIDGVYAFNYEMVEIGADLGLSLFDMPFNVYGNYVQNQDADDFDTGWLLGAKIGKASGWGTWQFAYHYQDLEADAVLGLLSDSDFAGGGTDGKGHRLSGKVGINKSWSVGLTWFLDNEAGEKNLADAGGAVDYDRIMIDTAWKY